MHFHKVGRRYHVRYIFHAGFIQKPVLGSLIPLVPASKANIQSKGEGNNRKYYTYDKFTVQSISYNDNLVMLSPPVLYAADFVFFRLLIAFL